MNICSNETNIQQIYDMFNTINEALFDHRLTSPEISVAVLPKGAQRLSLSRYISSAWNGLSHHKRAEITIDSSAVSPNNEKLVFTELLKCCVIHYCEENGIRCRSRNGFYFNTKFSNVAEEHGLKIGKNKCYGSIVVGLNKRGCALFERSDWFFTTERVHKLTYGSDPQKCSHNIKYQCPMCGNSVRATKEVRIMCCDCNVELLNVTANPNNKTNCEKGENDGRRKKV